MNTKEDKDAKPTSGGPIGQSIASALPEASTLPAISIPQEAAMGVVKGSLGFSALSGIGGMIYGALRAQPAILYGMQYGLNTFSFAFPIFAVRQYIAIPWYNEILHQRFGPDRIPSLHMHNIIPTTISGALMGGAMTTYFSGKQKLWAGARTFGIISLALQLASNEMSVLRINMLADQDGRSSIPLTQTGGSEVQAPASSGNNQTQMEKVSLRPKDEGVKQEQGFLGKAWDKVASWSPVHRISDEEYEKSLLRRREEVAEQLRSVDQRIAEEEKATHKV
ncbi:uncharacterized protein FA14DRAFT_36024 [Meira miltonrushii]|uniref:Uncharacterized protein n=1 Tax=Meira miltonrushii TaxID=1280837 RepID=A0A316VBB7_9BASI|nr:uncharacterized protein FA14DRAFT_36024 [Meira miltonrushii]PWN34937.1 hypothetical protein FA14DRAFT_36024 [Meira miltonrushii]